MIACHRRDISIESAPAYRASISIAAWQQQHGGVALQPAWHGGMKIMAARHINWHSGAIKATAKAIWRWRKAAAAEKRRRSVMAMALCDVAGGRLACCRRLLYCRNIMTRHGVASSSSSVIQAQLKNQYQCGLSSQRGINISISSSSSMASAASWRSSAA